MQSAAKHRALAFDPRTSTRSDRRSYEISRRNAAVVLARRRPTSITPPRTFDCEHFRMDTPHELVDIWISAKVSPYGTVKMTSGEMTMMIEKVLSNGTSHLKGESQKFEMPKS